MMTQSARLPPAVWRMVAQASPFREATRLAETSQQLRTALTGPGTLPARCAARTDDGRLCPRVVETPIEPLATECAAYCVADRLVWEATHGPPLIPYANVLHSLRMAARHGNLDDLYRYWRLLQALFAPGEAATGGQRRDPEHTMARVLLDARPSLATLWSVPRTAGVLARIFGPERAWRDVIVGLLANAPPNSPWQRPLEWTASLPLSATELRRVAAELIRELARERGNSPAANELWSLVRAFPGAVDLAPADRAALATALDEAAEDTLESDHGEGVEDHKVSTWAAYPRSERLGHLLAASLRLLSPNEFAGATRRWPVSLLRLFGIS